MAETTTADVVRRLKGWYRWLFGDQGTLVEVCDAFTLVTVVNSVMMITGHDTPKVGHWAYGHLLLRLGIVLLIFTIWDARGVRDDLARYASVLRRRSASIEHVQRVPTSIVGSPFNAICVIFTAVTVFICVSTILVVPQPIDGAEFYAALLTVFGAICVFVIALVSVDKTRSRRNGHTAVGW